jgi:hypothetical protein
VAAEFAPRARRSASAGSHVVAIVNLGNDRKLLLDVITVLLIGDLGSAEETQRDDVPFQRSRRRGGGSCLLVRTGDSVGPDPWLTCGGRSGTFANCGLVPGGAFRPEGFFLGRG